MFRVSRTSSENRSTPPKASSAARRAVAGSMPARMFCSVSMSRWNASSADISRSVAPRWNRARSRRRQPPSRSFPLGARDVISVISRALENEVDRADVIAPAARLGAQRSPAGRGERVVPRRVVLLGALPFALDPALLLEARQGGVERSLSHAQKVLGLLLDALAERPPVHRAAGERSENEEVERSAEEVGLCPSHLVPAVLSGSDITVQPVIVESQQHEASDASGPSRR